MNEWNLHHGNITKKYQIIQWKELEIPYAGNYNLGAIEIIGLYKSCE